MDVIHDGPDGSTVGVQIKRYKKERRIEAEQIRSLAGALLQNGHAKGIFVTTSKYRRGDEEEAAREFAPKGYPIELIDAKRFLAALGVAHHNTFEYDQKKSVSYVLNTGLHIGTGAHKDFVPSEDLRRRPAVVSSVLRSELLELPDDES